MSVRQQRQNWDDFRHFLAVARSGTLSAAADATGTDHTTVARRISRLEEACGAQMFFRSNAGYELTAAGEKLLPLAEAMEAGFIGAASLERENFGVAGTVRIGTPDGFGTFFLAPRVAKLAAAYPGLGGGYRDQPDLPGPCARRLPPADRLFAPAVRGGGLPGGACADHRAGRPAGA
jgi:DNA-binding transcriptional LysR family regulator